MPEVSKRWSALAARVRWLVPAGPSLSPRAIVLMCAWFGLVAGLSELGVLLAQDAIDPKVTVAMIRINQNYLWMVPTSDALLFSAAGLVLALLARWRPGLASFVAPFVIIAGACLAPLLVVHGLYPAVCVILALGIASRVAPRLRALGDRPRWVRVSLPALVGVVALLASFDAFRSRPAEAAGRARPDAPNVLLIVMDTVRADHLSLYGYDRETTPNLKRWASRGIRFDRARSTAPWTLPSHASMFTGRWPHQLSANVDHPLDESELTLAEYLGARGYATGGFVANTYYGNAWYGLDRGFHRYEDFYENRQITPLEVVRSSAIGRRIVERAGFEAGTPGESHSRKTASMINRDALDWLSGQSDRPFFAFLNYYDAHGPYEPPEGHRRRFGPAASDPAFKITTVKDLQDYKKKRALADPRKAEEANQLLVDSYDECIAHLDEQLGRLLDELDRRKVLEKTLVIVTSDHGEHFGDRGLFGHGHSLYRSLIDVPLLILPPSSKATSALSVREPVSLRDLPATVVDLLGFKGPAPFPGQSLARYWDRGPGQDTPGGDPPLSTVEHQKKFPPTANIPASLGPLGSIVDREMVYIRSDDGKEELYHLERDPAEVDNLAGKSEARAALNRLRTLFENLIRDDESKRPPPISPLPTIPSVAEFP